MAEPGCSSCAASKPALAMPFGRFLQDWISEPTGDSLCHGHYTLPQFPSLANTPPGMVIDADGGELLKSGTSTLAGNILVSEYNQRLYSDLLYIHRDGLTQEIDRLDAFGGVLLEQPVARVLARSAHVNLARKQTVLIDAQFSDYEAHARGTSEKVSYIEDKPLHLYDATYTTCAPGSNIWDLRASFVELDNATGTGIANHAVLYVKDVPLFYTPYITFPIGDARKSGFLPPSYSSATDDGVTILIPYYLNLAPNYDDTFMPQWYEKRGMLWRNEFRYLTEKTHGDLQLSYINDDKQYQTFKKDSLAENLFSSNDPRQKGVSANDNKRYAVSFANLTTFNTNWSSRLIYNEVSDDNYFMDFPSQPSNFDGSLNSRQLLREATLNYQQMNVTASLMAQEYQVLQPFDSDLYDEPYQIMPRLLINVDHPNLGNPAIDGKVRSEITRFAHNNDLITDSAVLTGDRFDIAPTLRYRLQTAYAFSTPQVELRYTAYQLERDAFTQNLGYDDSLSRTIPLFSLDNGLIFERDIQFFSSEYQQTLEPRLYYLYVPYKDQNQYPVFDDGLLFLSYDQLFRNNRFAGRDRVGDANQLAFGVSSRFLDPEQGNEYARLAIGQLFYFDNRDVTLCNSDIDPSCQQLEDPYANEETSDLIAQADFRFHPQWVLSTDGQWNPYYNRMDQYGVRIGYTHAEQQIIHVGYRNDREDQLGLETINQTDISGVWALNPRWKMIARWQYDYDKDTTLNSFAGVEYENCCWAVRLGGEKNTIISSVDKTTDNVIYLQFVFKGLTSLGNGYTDFVRSSVPGYRDTLGKTY